MDAGGFCVSASSESYGFGNMDVGAWWDERKTPLLD